MARQAPDDKKLHSEVFRDVLILRLVLRCFFSGNYNTKMVELMVHFLAGFVIRGTDENNFIFAGLVIRGTNEKIFLEGFVIREK